MAASTFPSGPVSTAEGRPRPRFSWISDRVLATMFLSPTMLLLLFITIFPLIWSLYLSFTKYSVISDANSGPLWIGFKNYGNILTDENLWSRFRVTASFVVPTVVIEMLFGFGIALLLNRHFKGRGLISTLILIPMMLTPVVVGLFWRFMLQGDIGVVNYFIRDVFGFKAVLWLTDQNTAVWSLVLVDVWQWTPFIVLISLAGLSAVPSYLYEAADVDRASGWFKFRNITLPIVSPLLLIALLFRLMDTYKLFDLAWVLTGGGPGEATKVLPLFLYKLAFGDFNTGKSSAIGYVMLVVVIALANILIRVLNQLKSGANA